MTFIIYLQIYKLDIVHIVYLLGTIIQILQKKKNAKNRLNYWCLMKIFTYIFKKSSYN